MEAELSGKRRSRKDQVPIIELELGTTIRLSGLPLVSSTCFSEFNLIDFILSNF